MKVYLIETSSGLYDDYSTYINTGYFDKDKAQEHIDKYNEDLNNRKLQSEECNNCECGKYDYLSKALRNCKLCARKSDIDNIYKIDGGLYFECKKSMDDYYIYDEHDARIKKVDIL